MSQRDFLQSVDADCHAAFRDAGMSDLGLYTAVGSVVEIPCRCYLDTVSIDELGESGLVTRIRKEMTILRSDVEQPTRGDLVTLDDQNYILQTRLLSDESMTRWTVNHD